MRIFSWKKKRVESQISSYYVLPRLNFCFQIILIIAILVIKRNTTDVENLQINILRDLKLFMYKKEKITDSLINRF